MRIDFREQGFLRKSLANPIESILSNCQTSNFVPHSGEARPDAASLRADGGLTAGGPMDSGQADGSLADSGLAAGSLAAGGSVDSGLVDDGPADATWRMVDWRASAAQDYSSCSSICNRGCLLYTSRCV